MERKNLLRKKLKKKIRNTTIFHPKTQQLCPCFVHLQIGCNTTFSHPPPPTPLGGTLHLYVWNAPLTWIGSNISFCKKLNNNLTFVENIAVNASKWNPEKHWRNKNEKIFLYLQNISFQQFKVFNKAKTSNVGLKKVF